MIQIALNPASKYFGISLIERQNLGKTIAKWFDFRVIKLKNIVAKNLSLSIVMLSEENVASSAMIYGAKSIEKKDQGIQDFHGQESRWKSLRNSLTRFKHWLKDNRHRRLPELLSLLDVKLKGRHMKQHVHQANFWVEAQGKCQGVVVLGQLDEKQPARQNQATRASRLF